MDGFTHKTHTTSRSHEYAYYIHKPSSTPTKPALFLCHGFPDSALLWVDIVPALLPLGHPIIVPDMLGYDGTSKPEDPEEYSTKFMANDLYELADEEGLGTIVPVGHDWGSFMAQRLYLWRPERCAGLVLLNAAYQPPSGAHFDLETMLELTEKRFGYPSFAYWQLFGSDDGATVLEGHLEAFFHLLNWDDPEAMKKVFCERGAMRRLVTETKPEDIPLKKYAQRPGFKEAWVGRFRRDGFAGPLCWYKATLRNVHSEAEKEIPRENFAVRVPCLYLSSNGDVVCRTDLMEPVRSLVPDLETFVVEANHWVTYEKPEEVRGYIAKWLKTKFPDSA